MSTASRSLTSRALYLPLSMAASVAGGLLASAVFGQVWKWVGGADQPPPDPKDLNQSGRQALAGAALQGLVFGLVRAAVARTGARGYRAVTHQDPPA